MFSHITINKAYRDNPWIKPYKVRSGKFGEELFECKGNWVPGPVSTLTKLINKSPKTVEEMQLEVLTNDSEAVQSKSRAIIAAYNSGKSVQFLHVDKMKRDNLTAAFNVFAKYLEAMPHAVIPHRLFPLATEDWYNPPMTHTALVERLEEELIREMPYVGYKVLRRSVKCLYKLNKRLRLSDTTPEQVWMKFPKQYQSRFSNTSFNQLVFISSFIAPFMIRSGLCHFAPDKTELYQFRVSCFVAQLARHYVELFRPKKSEPGLADGNGVHPTYQVHILKVVKSTTALRNMIKFQQLLATWQETGDSVAEAAVVEKLEWLEPKEKTDRQSRYTFWLDRNKVFNTTVPLDDLDTLIDDIEADMKQVAYQNTEMYSDFVVGMTDKLKLQLKDRYQEIKQEVAAKEEGKLIAKKSATVIQQPPNIDECCGDVPLELERRASAASLDSEDPLNSEGVAELARLEGATEDVLRGTAEQLRSEMEGNGEPQEYEQEQGSMRRDSLLDEDERLWDARNEQTFSADEEEEEALYEARDEVSSERELASEVVGLSAVKEEPEREKTRKILPHEVAVLEDMADFLNSPKT